MTIMYINVILIVLLPRPTVISAVCYECAFYPVAGNHQLFFILWIDVPLQGPCGRDYRSYAP